MFLQKLVIQSNISNNKNEENSSIFFFSKIVIHQPKRLQSKLEDAFQVVEAVGDKIKSYIQEKM
jgi:hypothetical protein